MLNDISHKMNLQMNRLIILKKEGRGQGTDEEYLSCLRVQDVNR